MNNLTQEELAQAIGVKRTTIAQYESGKIAPSKDVLMKTASYFRVTLDELMGSNEIEYSGIEVEQLKSPKFSTFSGDDFDSIRLLASDFRVDQTIFDLSGPVLQAIRRMQVKFNYSNITLRAQHRKTCYGFSVFLKTT